MGYWVCPRCGSNDAYEGNSLVSEQKQGGAVLMDTEFGMVGRSVGGGYETKNIRVVKCRDCGELLNGQSDYFLDEKDIREAEREERKQARREKVDNWCWVIMWSCFSPIAYFTWTNLSEWSLTIALVIEFFSCLWLAFSFEEILFKRITPLDSEPTAPDEFSAQQLCRAAEQGDDTAQYNLGVMYANGQGVKKDDKEATKWWRKSAEQNYDLAQYNLGMMYANGRGVAQEWSSKKGTFKTWLCKEAVKWYRKAAEQGLAESQFNLGVMYANGQEGVKKNEKEAVKWYRKAAEQGFAESQCCLGAMYVNGQGVKKDDKEALKWFRKAAEQGEAYSQYNLGWMYEYGQGVEQDEKEAVKWYRKAAGQGNEDAKAALKKIEK